MKTITKEFYENFLVSLWNDDSINSTNQKNRLYWWSQNLENHNHPIWAEEARFLYRVLEKKYNLLFLELFDELNCIVKKHPDLIPQLIEQEKKQHPELYDYESDFSDNELDQDIETFDSILEEKNEKEQGENPLIKPNHKFHAGLSGSLSHLKNVYFEHINIEALPNE